MPLHVLINDLSAPTGECSERIALARLEGLVGAIRALRRIAPDAVIGSAEPLANLSLGTNWPLASLRNRPASAEASTYLKTVIDNSPFLAARRDVPDGAKDAVEYRLADPANSSPVAVALGLAHGTGGIAVSLPTQPLWEQQLIALHRSSLDDDARVVTVAVEARNSCTSADVEWHREALADVILPGNCDGAGMWADRERLFPNLRFIPRTRAQIEQLEHGAPTLKSIAARLRGIDDAVGDWRRTSVPRPTFAFAVTPESRTRRALVRFNDEGGVEHVFSDHARYTPDEGRIHFVLLTTPVRHALVGHVGRKIGIG